MLLELEGLPLALPANDAIAPGETVRLFVDARDVSLALQRPEAISIRNILPATVKAVRTDKNRQQCDVELAIGSAQIWSRVTRAACEELALKPGRDVFALIKSVRLAGDL